MKFYMYSFCCCNLSDDSCSIFQKFCLFIVGNNRQSDNYTCYNALLVGITPFNGKSRAAEISKVLYSYIPNVARMKDHLRKYNVAFTKTAVENEKLKEKNRTLSASLDKAKEGSVLKRLEDAKLRQDYEAALKTLDSIPPEVIRFYENRTQEPVVRHEV